MPRWSAAIRRFVMIDEADCIIVALWILFTWEFEYAAETNPFLRIISATPGCGKSTLFEVLQRLARSAWLVVRISQSAFTRGMNECKRTLLLDEGDAYLNSNETMRNVLDGASDPDTAHVSLSVKTGDDWKPVELNVFVPIAIASIGPLRRMETVEDRSIGVHLKRATAAELKPLSKGRRRELNAVLEPLAAKCARWTADNPPNTEARPSIPDMAGREMDKWESLIGIADRIGSEWPARSRAIAVAKSNARGDDDKSIGVILLHDIRAVFEAKDQDRLMLRRPVRCACGDGRPPLGGIRPFAAPDNPESGCATSQALQHCPTQHTTRRHFEGLLLGGFRGSLEQISRVRKILPLRRYKPTERTSVAL